MSNLFDALHVSSSAIRALQTALESSQNNISNASTPGYVKQRANLEALPSQPLEGLPGGVRANGVQDSRNMHAETAVWNHTQSQGYHSGLAQSLALVSANFEVSGEQGIPGALNAFYQSASSWSVAPNSATARQHFLLAAERLAGSFRETAASLSQAASGVDGQIQGTVGRINEIGAQLADLNRQQMQSGRDAGIQARIFAALEELSTLTNFTTLRASNGSMTVLLGGQSPLVLGDRSQPIRLDSSQGQPVLFDDSGREITSLASQGQLGGLLTVRNQVLPSILNGQQTGGLDRLAAAVADRVNAIFSQASGGTPLFTYTAGSPAATLSLDSAVTANNLASALSGPPPVSNGVPLALASLANSTDPADHLDGSTYVEFYGALGGRIGQQQATAADASARQAALVAGAKTLREQLSGVSLDEEAVLILQYQKGYQAAAQMIRVIDELTESVLGMLS